MNLEINGFALNGLSKINVILGKNGCGKSTFMKNVESNIISNYTDYGSTRYMTPERGGSLSYEPSIEQNLNNDVNWMPSTRRVNQYPQFRQQTVAQYKMLETKILRAVSASVKAGNSTHPKDFETVVTQINELLDNIVIEHNTGSGVVFKIYNKKDHSLLEPSNISSGEAELISMAIECISFAESIIANKKNILFLDEPDVHLHPDLQARFIRFLVGLVEEHDFIVVMATHSTAILGELSGYEHSTVELMVPGQIVLEFDHIDEEYRKILPVFGAHPLSNVFNTSPILLLEGEDDERIWQQVVRSSERRINLYPVATGSKTQMANYENKVKSIILSVYENALAFSLRDRDEDTEDIEDQEPVVRMRLSCRAAENLLLCNETLDHVGITWEEFKSKSDEWIAKNINHAKFKKFVDFKQSDYDRKSFDIKELRMLIVGDIMASDKPWEVIVGQTIAKQRKNSNPQDHSIQNYLGVKVVKQLIPA